MGQFDVHRPVRRGQTPLLVDLQAEVLARLSTRLVAPLIPLKRFGARPITRLNPIVTFDRADHVVVLQEAAAVACQTLGPVVGNLAAHRAALVAGLDLLIVGI